MSKTPIERIDEEIDRTLEYLLRHARLASQMTTEDLSASFEERLRMCVGDCLKIAAWPQSILADDVTDARRLRERAKAECKPPTPVPTLAERAEAALRAMPDRVFAKDEQLMAWDAVHDALQAAERGESVVALAVPLGSVPAATLIKRWMPKMLNPPIDELRSVLEALGSDQAPDTDPQREQATRRKSRSS